MSIEENAKVLREVMEPARVPLENVPQILESYGYLEGQADKLNRCRAIMALIRQILKDDQVADLLALTLEVHALRSIQGLFDMTTGALFTEGFWKEFDARLRKVDQRVVQLKHAAIRKIGLLDFLTDKLVDLECEENLVLPLLPDDLFPEIVFPD